MPKNVNIELLYLDLDVCEPCQGTDKSLVDALSELSSSLATTGHQVNLKKIHIDSEDKAIQYQFQTSPTIRVNGVDIQLDYQESLCPTCGTLTDAESVDCRVWNYQGKQFSTPPKQLIVDSVIAAVKADSNATGNNEEFEYQLPDNLRAFFARKISNGCNTGDGEHAQTCC